MKDSFQNKKDGLRNFKDFFNCYSKRLYTVACKHVSEEDAEDIVQELFVELWTKKDAIQIKTSWDAYLYSILKYKIFKFLDAQNATNENLKEALNEVANISEACDFEQLFDLLNESMNQLPLQTKNVFEKKYYENKKNAEIAQELSISTETVKTHLKRGLKTMRVNMKGSLANFLFL